MKKMKFLLLPTVIITLSLIFSGCAETPSDDTVCSTHTDGNSDSICDRCGKLLNKSPVCTVHIDIDSNNRCDTCGKELGASAPVCSEHIDTDENNVCDTCGEYIPVCSEHIDTDSDNICDSCGTAIPVKQPCTEHTDDDGDYVCDACGEDMPEPLPVYTVSLPSGDGYTANYASREVEQGGSASFMITLTDTRDTLIVKYGDSILIGKNGVYILSDVREDITLTVEVIKYTPDTLSNSIIISDTALSVASAVLSEHLGSGYKVKVMTELADDTLFTGCIILGTEHYATAFQSEDKGEEYHIKGDGNNIYIDGNCTRALLYGAYDFLRAIGFEFYTSELTVRPASLDIDYSVDIRDAADFAVRGYLSADTGYTNDIEDYKFIVASKNNNGQFGTLGAGYGGQIEYGYYDNPLHNYLEFFIDQTEGKYGKTVSTGVGSIPTGYAPCLTNGITYNNASGADSTLNYAIARMKELILSNPDKYYFTLTQNDGPTWYCDCDKCTESNTEYNHSGTLVRFMNAMIAALEADSALAGRDFKIITFAYGFTKTAPKGGVTVDDKLCIWYAQYQDSRYSMTDDGQTADFKDDLLAWSELTKSQGASMALWLYDTSFNNYLAYYPSTTLNNALKETVMAAKELGVENLFVLGAYLAENNWQAQMKTYIWSKLLWDTSLDVEELQNEFIDAYFGPAAEKVKEYIATYDAIYKDTAREVASGYNYYQCWWVDIDEHLSALKIALAAVEAVEATEEGSVYRKRAKGVVVSSYAAIIYDYETYYKACSLLGLGITGTQDRVDYLGAASKNQDTAEAKANFIAMFKAACKDAGITKACEATLYDANGQLYQDQIQGWLDIYVAQSWG